MTTRIAVINFGPGPVVVKRVNEEGLVVGEHELRAYPVDGSQELLVYPGQEIHIGEKS